MNDMNFKFVRQLISVLLLSPLIASSVWSSGWQPINPSGSTVRSEWNAAYWFREAVPPAPFTAFERVHHFMRGIPNLFRMLMSDSVRTQGGGFFTVLNRYNEDRVDETSFASTIRTVIIERIQLPQRQKKFIAIKFTEADSKDPGYAGRRNNFFFGSTLYFDFGEMKRLTELVLFGTPQERLLAEQLIRFRLRHELGHSQRITGASFIKLSGVGAVLTMLTFMAAMQRPIEISCTMTTVGFLIYGFLRHHADIDEERDLVLKDLNWLESLNETNRADLFDLLQTNARRLPGLSAYLKGLNAGVNQPDKKKEIVVENWAHRSRKALGKNLRMSPPLRAPILPAPVMDAPKPYLVTVRIGGSNIGLIVYERSGNSIKFIGKVSWSWRQVRQHFRREDISHLKSDFLRALGERMRISLLKPKGIEVDEIGGIAWSVAGPTDGITATLTNTSVKMIRSALPEEFAHELGITLDARARIMTNDGFAAHFAEHVNPEGKLRELPLDEGIALILGTGKGGHGPGVVENGHTVLYDGENYIVKSMEWLQSQVSENGRRLSEGQSFHLPHPNSGLVYSEHRLAGPWVAIRFLQELKEKQPKTYIKFVEAVAPSLAQKGVEKNALTAINELLAVGDRPLDVWGKETDTDVVLAVNEFISKNNDSQVKTSPERFAYQFNERFIKELGKALGAMAEAYPNQYFVLVSGMVEARRDDRRLQNVLKQASKFPGQIVISELEGDRENYAVARLLMEQQDAQRLAEMPQTERKTVLIDPAFMFDSSEGLFALNSLTLEVLKLLNRAGLSLGTIFGSNNLRYRQSIVTARVTNSLLAEIHPIEAAVQGIDSVTTLGAASILRWFFLVYPDTRWTDKAHTLFLTANKDLAALVRHSIPGLAVIHAEGNLLESVSRQLLQFHRFAGIPLVEQQALAAA